MRWWWCSDKNKTTKSSLPSYYLHISPLLRWEKWLQNKEKGGKNKKEAGEMGSHKRQMWSDGCCCSPGRCAALLELFAGMSYSFSPVFSLETGKSLTWKVANGFALAHTQVWKCQRYLAKGHRAGWLHFKCWNVNRAQGKSSLMNRLLCKHPVCAFLSNVLSVTRR